MLSLVFLAVTQLSALPTATIERGGATFDFKAIGERNVSAGLVGENLVTQPDFSLSGQSDPYRWRGGEYCFIHREDVDRAGPLSKGVKAGVEWSAKDGVARIVKSPKILELVGGENKYAMSTSGAWTKFVKLPDTNGGAYRFSLKYKMKHELVGGKKGGGCVIATYVSGEPADKPLDEVPAGRLDYLKLIDSAAEWTSGSINLLVPPGTVAVNFMIRIDSIGVLEFKDPCLRRCLERKEDIYLHAEPVGSLDRSFHISQGQSSVVVYQWLAKDLKKRYDLRKLAFDFDITGDFEILEKPVPTSRPTNADFGWFTHGVIVKSNAEPGSRGTLSARVLYEGRVVSNTDVIELVSVPKIVAKRPQYYTTGFTYGGPYMPLRDPVARAEFMKSCTECGLTWAFTNSKDLADAWRKAGAKIVVSEQVGANGYRLGSMEVRKSRPADERYVALCHLDLEKLGIKADNFGEISQWRKTEFDLAVCPVAVYEEMPHFKNVFLPWLKKAMQGMDGDWANWEPYGFDGKGCFCDKCGRAFARYLGVEEAEVMKDWPKCVIVTSTFRGRLADKFPRFRSLEHAKLIRTVDKYVTEYTGGPGKSVGFMPGVGFDQMTSIGCTVGAEWYSPKDYQEDMKWMEPWGPYPHWKNNQPYAYLKSDVIRGWCAAKDIRETIDKLPEGRRPKIQSFPHGMQGATWITQPEWMRLNMDSFFFNGWESTVIYFFPKGYDARWWRVFAEHTTRSAMYENYVFKGVRNDAQNVLDPVAEYALEIPVMGGRFPQFNGVSLLQHAAYELNGRRIVAVLNFWDFGDAFFKLRANGLAAGDYRILDECGVLWVSDRGKDTWSASELAEGVDLVVPALRTRVFEIVPAAEKLLPKSVFTRRDVASLYALRRPGLAAAADWDRNYEAHNKVEKGPAPTGVYR